MATPLPPVANRILLTVCQCALLNACFFAAVDIATLIVNRTPCTKSTWLFRCAALTDDAAAAEELSCLLYGELWLCVLAALAAPLHVLLTTTTSIRSRWPTAVDFLAWVALSATVGIHCLQVARDRVYLAAGGDAGGTHTIVDIILTSVCLAVDMLAVVFCCSALCLELLDDDDDDGEV